MNGDVGWDLTVDVTKKYMNVNWMSIDVMYIYDSNASIAEVLFVLFEALYTVTFVIKICPLQDFLPIEESSWEM